MGISQLKPDGVLLSPMLDDLTGHVTATALPMQKAEVTAQLNTFIQQTPPEHVGRNEAGNGF